jgi:hypothetical protein
MRAAVGQPGVIHDPVSRGRRSRVSWKTTLQQAFSLFAVAGREFIHGCMMYVVSACTAPMHPSRALGQTRCGCDGKAKHPCRPVDLSGGRGRRDAGGPGCSLPSTVLQQALSLFPVPGTGLIPCSDPLLRSRAVGRQTPALPARPYGCTMAGSLFL